jgi:hypothetical protein
MRLRPCVRYTLGRCGTKGKRARETITVNHMHITPVLTHASSKRSLDVGDINVCEFHVVVGL